MTKHRAHVHSSRRATLTRWATRRTARDDLHVRHRDQTAAVALYDLHGNDLYTLASVLTDDPELAGHIMVQAVVAHHSHPCTRQELSAAVHVAWAAWGQFTPATHRVEAPMSARDAVLRDLHVLPDDQRAALGLCRFGAHTYQQAAETLDLPASEVLGLLGDAMRALAPPVFTATAPAA